MSRGGQIKLWPPLCLDPKLTAAASRKVLKLFNNINKDERNIIHWEMCIGLLLQHVVTQPEETIRSKLGIFTLYKVALSSQAK